MLADFYIPGLLNDMKIVVEKTSFRGKTLYRCLVSPKKIDVTTNYRNWTIKFFKQFQFR